jgi:hypothetical protein
MLKRAKTEKKLLSKKYLTKFNKYGIIYHTRASDDIRIKYDSDRDGWVVEQPITDKDKNRRGDKK